MSARQELRGATTALLALVVLGLAGVGLATCLDRRGPTIEHRPAAPAELGPAPLADAPPVETGARVPLSPSLAASDDGRTAVSLGGLVLDERGVPQASVELSVLVRPLHAAPAARVRVLTGEDGRFTLREPLPRGLAELRLENRVLESGRREHELPLDGAHAEARIVVRAQDTRPSLAGLVIDELGHAIPDAMVDVKDYGDSPAQSDERGAFRICVKPVPQGAKSPYVLKIRAEGFQDATEIAAPGSHELRIVLRRAAVLTVRARSADGRSLRRFGVALCTSSKERGGNEMFNRVERLLPIEDRAEGELRLANVQAGRYLVLVEPDSRDAAISKPLPILVVAGRELEVMIDVPRLVSRLARVVTGSGEPVAQAVLQVLEPAGIEVPFWNWERPASLAEQHADPEGRWGALRLARFTTDARGEVLLTGPADRPLGLAVHGDGICTEVLEAVRLDEASPLLVQAERGAALLGRLVPEASARRLHALGASLVLMDERFGSTAEDAAFEADGRFAMRGLPHGTWQLRLVLRGASTHLATITTLSGESRAQDFDVAQFAPAEVELTVLEEGRPLAWREMRIWSARDSVLQRHLLAAVTDAEGRCRFTTLAGRHGVELAWRPDRGQAVLGTFVATAGTPLRIGMDVRLARARLRVERPDGEPAYLARLALRSAELAEELSIETGANGLTTPLVLPVGRYQVLARRFRSRSLDPRDADWLPLATVAFAPSTADEVIVLRLPSDWWR